MKTNDRSGHGGRLYWGYGACTQGQWRPVALAISESWLLALSSLKTEGNVVLECGQFLADQQSWFGLHKNAQTLKKYFFS